MAKSIEMLAFDNTLRAPAGPLLRARRAHEGRRAAGREGQPSRWRELLGAQPERSRRTGAALLVGNEIPAGAEPIALAYAGHQFGGFVPQLGDGRAILLGEVVGTRRPAARHPAQGRGTHAVLARRRRTRGARARAARVRRERGDGGARHPDDARARRRDDGRARRPRGGAARRRAHARRGEPPPRRHVRVLRRARRSRGAGRAHHVRARASLPGRRGQRQRCARAARARDRRAGAASSRAGSASASCTAS